MENITIEPTKKSLEVECAPGYFKLSGNSILSDPRKFFKQIVEWVEEYIKELHAEENVKTVWDDDISVYMVQSDIMISDISAVCYEWFHLDRPIVFANPAPNHYGPSTDKFSNNYAWQAGDVLYKEEDIVPVIKKNLESDTKREIRNQLLHYSFFEPDGRATERQVNAIKAFYEQIKNKSKMKILIRSLYKLLRFP